MLLAAPENAGSCSHPRPAQMERLRDVGFGAVGKGHSAGCPPLLDGGPMQNQSISLQGTSAFLLSSIIQRIIITSNLLLKWSWLLDLTNFCASWSSNYLKLFMWAFAINLKLRLNKISTISLLCSAQVCLLKENIVSHAAFDLEVNIVFSAGFKKMKKLESSR